MYDIHDMKKLAAKGKVSRREFVQFAVAAGMTVIGFLGGSHIRAGHADKLRTAGAHAIAENFDEVEHVVRGIVEID